MAPGLSSQAMFPVVTDRPPPDRQRLLRRLQTQGRTAAQLGSPLYASLFTSIVADVAAAGPCWHVLKPYAHEPDNNAVSLRFMAAVHRLVLRREAPALALHYPSAGGQAPVAGAWPPFRDTVETHRSELIELTGRPCQTNEVGRSAALAPALLWLQGRYDLPLNHLEIGSSAGLNLRWDHFCYGTVPSPHGTVQWGDPVSPVDLTGEWVVAPPDLPRQADVAARRGCDPIPLDPFDPIARESLTASVWPDQRARHQRLKGAFQLAQRIPATVDKARAGEWLAVQLPDRPAGLTVVTHSIVWRYLSAEEQTVVMDLLKQHGAQATSQRPLAWVRHEPAPPRMTYDGKPYPVTVTEWPGGRTSVVATAHAHGQQMEWGQS